MYKPYNLTLPLYNSICVTVNSTTRIIGTRGIHQRVKQFKIGPTLIILLSL